MLQVSCTSMVLAPTAFPCFCCTGLFLNHEELLTCIIPFLKTHHIQPFPVWPSVWNEILVHKHIIAALEEARLLYEMSKCTWTCMLVHCQHMRYCLGNQTSTGSGAGRLMAYCNLILLFCWVFYIHKVQLVKWMYVPCMPHTFLSLTGERMSPRRALATCRACAVPAQMVLREAAMNL